MKDTTLGFLFVGMLLIGAAADKATQPAATPAELKDAAAIIQQAVDDVKGSRFSLDDNRCGAGTFTNTGSYSTAIGYCAGWGGLGSRDILVGACTRLPTPTTDDFVNIGNKLCFWRTTGERAD